MKNIGLILMQKYNIQYKSLYSLSSSLSHSVSLSPTVSPSLSFSLFLSLYSLYIISINQCSPCSLGRVYSKHSWSGSAIIDGNLEIGAHVWGEIANLIRESVFLFFKTFSFIHAQHVLSNHLI